MPVSSLSSNASSCHRIFQQHQKNDSPKPNRLLWTEPTQLPKWCYDTTRACDKKSDLSVQLRLTRLWINSNITGREKTWENFSHSLSLFFFLWDFHGDLGKSGSMATRTTNCPIEIAAIGPLKRFRSATESPRGQHDPTQCGFSPIWGPYQDQNPTTFQEFQIPNFNPFGTC